jgi:hypothetical protein
MPARLVNRERRRARAGKSKKRAREFDLRKENKREHRPQSRAV